MVRQRPATHELSGGTGKFVKISGFEQGSFAPDGLIAESLGHFDAADYERQFEVQWPTAMICSSF
jgi:hypothetical protein